MNELMEEHSGELSTDQLKDLQERQRKEFGGEIEGSAKEAEEELGISTKEIQKSLKT